MNSIQKSIGDEEGLLDNKDTKPNIYQRINLVMKDVTYVKKDAQISGAGARYPAVTHDQVTSVLRSSLVKHGIVVHPRQLTNEMPIVRDLTKDIKMHLYSATYEIGFVNIDDPKDLIIIKVNSHASDNGDKAPGKAMSYAVKMAMLKIFCLETGENDESRVETSRTINDKKAQLIRARLAKTESDLEMFLHMFSITSLDEMLESDYPRANAALLKKEKFMKEIAETGAQQ